MTSGYVSQVYHVNNGRMSIPVANTILLIPSALLSILVVIAIPTKQCDRRWNEAQGGAEVTKTGLAELEAKKNMYIETLVQVLKDREPTVLAEMKREREVSDEPTVEHIKGHASACNGSGRTVRVYGSEVILS